MMFTAVTDDESKVGNRNERARSAILGRVRANGLACLVASLLAAPAVAAGTSGPSTLDETIRLAALDPVLIGLLQDAGTAGQPNETSSEESWLGLDEVDAGIYNDIATDILTQSEIGYNRPGEFRPESRRAFKAGDLLVYPYLQQRFGYNDNIFLEDGKDDGDAATTDDDENDDYFSLTKLGALARVTFAQGEHNLEFGGEAAWNQFFDEGDDSYFEGTAGAAWNFRSGNVYGKLADRFERREDPVEIDFSGDLFRRNINTLNGIFGTDLDAINLEGEGNWELTDFTDDDFDYINRDEWWVALRPGVYLNPDVRLYVEGLYGERIMDQNDSNNDGVNDGINDSWWGEGSLGLTGMIAEHVNGRVQAGYHYEKFDDNGAANVDSAGNPLDDTHDDFIALASVRFDVSNDTTVDTAIIRTQQFSTSTAGNFQVLTRADLTVTHVLYPNLLGRVGGFAETANVDNDSDLTRFGFGLGLKYRLTSYLDLDADYAYKERNVHNTSFGGYTNNIVSVGATLQF
jgi:hypothetical protein